jgi:thymidylate synthase
MNNLDTRYQALLQDILDNGVEKKDRTGTGTLSVFGRQIRHKMSEGFPLLTTKKMAWNVMVAELLWFLRGDTNIKFLLDYDCHIWTGDAYKRYVEAHKKEWSDKMTPEQLEKSYPDVKEFENLIKTFPEFAKTWGELGPIYGKQWRSWNGRKTDGFVEYESNGYNENIKGIDQIQNLINELKTNPDSRRLMVSAWNVGELDQMVLPPCHYGFQVYTRELSLEERIQWVIKNRDIELDNLIITEEAFSERTPTRAISLMWNQRSVDTFLGLPFNIASYGLLLEIIAKEVNMVPDELIGNLGDVHLYSNHIEQAKEQIWRTAYELPKVEITERNWYQHQLVKERLGEKTFSEKILSYRPDCFELIDYQSHPKIKAPLSN